ncbi:MAG: SDR family oxidoreductase [Synergistaceae bacterium]|jgi:nucleoside-diphosphate-sugar epimerase|nr:SDR family oxidoreductase [Synergistaceae bacterium]
MNVLITGNMGYVGSVLAREIKRRNQKTRVTGLDSAYFAGCLLDRKSSPERYVDIQLHKDARDIVPADFEDTDAVICLAALSNDPMGNRYASQTSEVNYRAIERAAAAAKEAGVKRFVFASSCSVYGFSENGECDESSPINPLTEYARSKVSAEHALERFAGGDFKVTCFRFATACGASPRLRLDLVLNDFVASAVTRNKIEILSDGTPWRPLIDVKNMAETLAWASAQDIGEPYVILNAGSNDWNFRVRDLAEKVREVIPETDIFINPEGQADKRSYRVRFDKFAEMSGGQVKIGDVRDTVREIRGILTDSSFADADFRNSEYMRLNMLKHLESVRAVDGDLRWIP